MKVCRACHGTGRVDDDDPTDTMIRKICELARGTMVHDEDTQFGANLRAVLYEHEDRRKLNLGRGQYHENHLEDCP